MLLRNALFFTCSLISTRLSIVKAQDASLILYPTQAAYPYAVHTPPGFSNSTPPLPVVLNLHGNGSAGAVAELNTHTTWDASGLLLSMYDGGNRTGAQQILAENFIVVLPLLPSTSASLAWNPASVISVLRSAAATYPIDPARVVLTGFSIGSIGCWETAFYSPSTFAAIVPSGGGSGFTSARLSKLLNVTPPVSVYAFAATGDVNQPLVGIEANMNQLEALPGASADNISFQILNGTHQTLTSIPFLEVSLWEWILNQTRAVNTSNTTSTSASTNITNGVTVSTTSLVSQVASPMSATATGATATVLPASLSTSTKATSGGERRLKFW